MVNIIKGTQNVELTHIKFVVNMKSQWTHEGEPNGNIAQHTVLAQQGTDAIVTAAIVSKTCLCNTYLDTPPHKCGKCVDYKYLDDPFLIKKRTLLWFIVRNICHYWFASLAHKPDANWSQLWKAVPMPATSSAFHGTCLRLQILQDSSSAHSSGTTLWGLAWHAILTNGDYTDSHTDSPLATGFTQEFVSSSHAATGFAHKICNDLEVNIHRY